MSNVAAYANINSEHFDLGYYTVLPPRTNFGQGEVHSSHADTWMSNGSPGSTVTGAWSADGVNYYIWGGFSSWCVDPPYTLARRSNGATYVNAGY